MTRHDFRLEKTNINGVKDPRRNFSMVFILCLDKTEKVGI